MKRVIIIISVVVILVVAGLVVAFTTSRGKNNKEMPIKTEVAKRGDFVIKINASGNLESLLSVEVKSNVEGEIKKLSVKDGDLVQKGQVLLKINDEQIREEMKQVEANVSAARAQLDQAKSSLAIKQKQLDSDLQQQKDAVIQAQTSLNVVKATTLQQIAQQETDIQNTKGNMEQDNIALKQAQISLKQTEITLSDLKQSESAAKVDLDNAESELKRNQELYEKKYIPKKSLEDAQAAQANSSSRYESAQKKVQSQDETINSQKETITMREQAVQMRKTTIDFNEQNLKLVKQTRVAQEEQATTALKIAQTRLKQLQDNINDEKDISRFSLESAKANLLKVESTLNNVKERLGWTTIIAPMSGIVINLAIEEGEIVTSGRSAFSQSPALMQVVDLSQMVVKTFINEVDMEKLSLGQKAEVRTRAYAGKSYKGEVREVAPSGLPRDNIIYFEVVIAVLGSPKELRPGMTADVDIIVEERKDALLLPIVAVKTEQSSTALLTVSEKDLSKLKTDQAVELENERGSKLQGKISKLMSENKEGNVEVILESAKRGAKPGKATFKLIVDGKAIPDVTADVTSKKESYVMLMPKGKEKEKGSDGNGSAVKGIRTLVEIGEANDSDIEILKGLNAGDKVIIQLEQQPEAGQQNGQQRRGR
jgi:multidrug efflux pump subunit AcrA (membrane-fusion protein)